MINPPKLIGHRGVKNLSPENTIDSIKLAKKLGLAWVEFDVKISKDQIPILLHDDNLDRTTNGKGISIDFNYKDLRKLDAGCHFYNTSTSIYIPTLYEVLIFCRRNKIGVNIELKPNSGFEKENVKSIAKVLKNINYEEKYFFSSFDFNSIILMKELIPEANYGFLIDEFNHKFSINDLLILCKKYKISICGFNKSIFFKTEYISIWNIF